jgi:serine/threonine protein kinase
VRVPPGYAIDRILSPGPVVLVATATAPGGRPAVLKAAVHDRSIEILGREAAILRALEASGTPGVPRVVGDGGTWIAVERIDAPTLAEGAKAFRAQPDLWPRIARAVFERLAAVHDAKDGVGRLDVIHGDISPDNVFVTTDGATSSIADYGLSRWRGGGPPNDGTARGTMAFAAPEVARGERSGARADDFAMAASLLYAATGVHLRTARSPPAKLLAEAAEQRFDASHPWAARARELFPPAMAATVLQCLAYDPRDRPHTTPRLVLDAEA